MFGCQLLFTKVVVLSSAIHYVGGQVPSNVQLQQAITAVDNAFAGTSPSDVRLDAAISQHPEE